jgi:drug/metabolite transporter (DMT)-like permease
MTLAVSFAVLFAALLHASWNAMIKGSRDVLLDTASIVVGAGVLAAPMTFVLPLPALPAWPYLVASATIHLVYYFLMVSAYRAGDLSLVYPLMRGVAPLLTAVLGIGLLHERPSTIAWTGMLLISGGVFALSLRALRSRFALARETAAIGFALTNAAVIAAYTLIDGYGARLAGNPWSYIVWLFAVDSIPFAAFVLLRRRERFLAYVAANPARGVIGGGLSAAAYAISVWAMTKAPIALVASLRETSVLFAALIGARLLREKLTPRRWFGIAAVLAGVAALKAA